MLTRVCAWEGVVCSAEIQYIPLAVNLCLHRFSRWLAWLFPLPASCKCSSFSIKSCYLFVFQHKKNINTHVCCCLLLESVHVCDLPRISINHMVNSLTHCGSHCIASTWATLLHCKSTVTAGTHKGRVKTEPTNNGKDGERRRRWRRSRRQAGVEVPSIINSYKNTETSNKLQVFSCISAKRNWNNTLPLPIREGYSTAPATLHVNVYIPSQCGAAKYATKADLSNARRSPTNCR